MSQSRPVREFFLRQIFPGQLQQLGPAFQPHGGGHALDAVFDGVFRGMQGFGHVEIACSPQKLPKDVQIQTVHPGQQFLETEDLPHMGVLIEIAGELRRWFRRQRVRHAGFIRRFQPAGYPDAAANVRLLFQLAA